MDLSGGLKGRHGNLIIIIIRPFFAFSVHG